MKISLTSEVYDHVIDISPYDGTRNHSYSAPGVKELLKVVYQMKTASTSKLNENVSFTFTLAKTVVQECWRLWPRQVVHYVLWKLLGVCRHPHAWRSVEPIGPAKVASSSILCMIKSTITCNYPIVMIYPCMSFQRGLLASNVSITPLN